MKNNSIQAPPVVNLLIGCFDLLLLTASVYLAHQAACHIETNHTCLFKLRTLMVLACLAYVPAFLYFPPLLYRRIIHMDRIVERTFRMILVFCVLYTFVLILLKEHGVSLWYVGLLTAFGWLSISIERISIRKFIKSLRHKGKNQKNIILVGHAACFQELFKEMSSPDYGFKILGIFHNDPNPENDILPLPYLGQTNQVTEFLHTHQQVEAVYCTMQENDQQDAKSILQYCKNSLVRFYVLPVFLNQLKKQMVTTQQGSQVLLTTRTEPLSNINNLILKRAFDLVVSTIFLLTLFPIVYIIVAIVIKIQSPGPVLFRQERSGLNGKVFVCYKFRSMHVNKDADRVQCTLNDPRKFKFGNLMRKTNIDELPQFINVFLGNMSIVGPRPHMLLHTEQYSQLIKEYMVRHWVKPGITGWAQVMGLRGETKELKQMEDRVKADIWYVENWNFWLDVKIIFKTAWNMISHNEKNAY